VILVDTSLADAFNNVNLLEEPRAYLAAGELKGGIDPAGADEHWKTARSALERIRARFNELGIVVPRLFFVGAAIEERMSNEIFGYLRNGTLDHAANLTKREQVEDLAQWLVSL
jgi:type II restriction enzyme